MSSQVFISVLLYILLVVFIITLLYFVIFVVFKTLLGSKGVSRSMEKLNGKVVLVTGGSQGIGLEIARDLAQRGAEVIIACRNQKKGKDAVVDIIKSTGNYKVEYKQLDLSNFNSIRNFAAEFNRYYNCLDILVNNAGVIGVSNFTEDRIHIIMQTNYYGPFLLTMLLMKTLIKSSPSRIVNISTRAHLWADLDNIYGANVTNFEVFCNSKVFQLLWTKALAKKLPAGVTVNACHPTPLATEKMTISLFVKNILRVLVKPLIRIPEDRVQTPIHLCVSKEVKNITGGYFEDCKMVPPQNSLMNDEKALEKIWNLSIMMTKIDENLTVFK